MNYRTHRILLGFSCLIIAVLLIIPVLYTCFGRTLIEMMYEGTSPLLFLNSVIEGQSEHPLFYYAKVADRIFLNIYLHGIAISLIVLLIVFIAKTEHAVTKVVLKIVLIFCIAATLYVAGKSKGITSLT